MQFIHKLLELERRLDSCKRAKTREREMMEINRWMEIGLKKLEMQKHNTKKIDERIQGMKNYE